MTRPLQHLHIATGPAGWVRASWHRKGEPENVAFVRLAPPEHEKQAWGAVALSVSKKSRPRWLSPDLVADVPLHRIAMAVQASKVFQSGLLDLINEPNPSDLDDAFWQTYEKAPRMKIDRRPTRSEMTDDFYRHVALVYRWALEAGLPPLKTMAEDSGIPQSTIARWVAEARKPERGFLPPATPGRVSA